MIGTTCNSKLLACMSSGNHIHKVVMMIGMSTSPTSKTVESFTDGSMCKVSLSCCQPSQVGNNLLCEVKSQKSIVSNTCETFNQKFWSTKSQNIAFKIRDEEVLPRWDNNRSRGRIRQIVR